MPQAWRVVGGEATGGILVRSGRDLRSSEAGERLATGAVVREESLVSRRLQFSKLLGDGPSIGWVSISSNGKDLLVKCDHEDASPKPPAGDGSESDASAPTAAPESCEEADGVWQKWLDERFGAAVESPSRVFAQLGDIFQQLQASLKPLLSAEAGERASKQHEMLASTLQLLRQTADQLDPPQRTPWRLFFRCATPGCPFRVHSWEALGDFCCNACHAACGRELNRSSWAPAPPWDPRRGAGAGRRQASWWRESRGPELTRAASHGVRCERAAPRVGASRADGSSCPLSSDELKQLEFDDAVHLVSVHVNEQPGSGTDRGWLDADPGWSRSGSLAVGKWVSSIIRDSWGSPSTCGPQQLLEGGLWASERGRTSDQWIIFDLGRQGLVSEVRVRGHYGQTTRNARSMQWQAGTGIDGPWHTEATLTGKQSNAWSVAVMDPPVASRWWRLFVNNNWGDEKYVWLCGFGIRLICYDDESSKDSGGAAREQESRDLRKEARCDWLTNQRLRRDDADWEPLYGYEKLRLHALLRDKVLFFEDAPYMDSNRGAAELARAVLARPVEEGWSLDHSPNFFCELAHEGFQPSTREVLLGEDLAVQVLAPRFEFCRSILEPLETHVTRKARRRARGHTLTVDAAYDDVMLNCIRQHGEEWLLSGQRWLQRAVRKSGYTGFQEVSVAVRSFELWDADGRLVAGDLGYTVGGVYVSQTGFHLRGTRGLGELLLALVVALLHKTGHAWLDLGTDDPLAPDLGARTLDRMSWLERFHAVRSRRCQLPEASERFAGAALLEHLLSCQRASKPACCQPRALRELSAFPGVLAVADQTLAQLWGCHCSKESADPSHFTLVHSGSDEKSSLRYLLTLPAPAAGGAALAPGAASYPLLVYLHSAPSTDERMNTPARQLRSLLEQAPQCASLERGGLGPGGGFIGVAPFCPLTAASLPNGSQERDLYWFKTCVRSEYESWDFSGARRCPEMERLVVGLVARACAELPVDPKRVYFVGHSCGGYGVLRLAELLPELPAAVVPISGYYPQLSSQDHDVAALAQRLCRVPRVWPMHCARDQQCRVQSPHVARAYEELQKACGVEVEWVSAMLSLGVHGDCHWALKRILSDPGRFFEELLQTSRGQAADVAAYLHEQLELLRPPSPLTAPVSISTGIYGHPLRLRRRSSK